MALPPGAGTVPLPMLSIKELRQLSARLPTEAFVRQLGPFALIQRPPDASDTDLSQNRTQVAPAKDTGLAMAALLFGFDDLLVCTLPPLDGVDALVVGRLPDCDLLLDDPTVSKHHAVLRWDAASEQASLQDQGSTNGSYVNGRLVFRREVSLRDGDLLGFGDVAFWYILTPTLHTRLRREGAKLGARSG